jgi:hypothetical protein
MGCLATVPVLLSVANDPSIDFAVLGPVAHPAAVENSLPQRATETAPSCPRDELYLIHHRFLI